ncbi:MAG: HupE/UreJ family protein [Hyphomonadaceae bacterium]
MKLSHQTATFTALCVLTLLLAAPAFAHAIGGKDAAFVAGTTGPDPFPFIYLGAKHMVTGYDHLAYLAGVVFFLYRMKDVLLYVSLFSLGHSTTLLLGVLLKIDVSSYLVDAVIGLSVCYKAFENLGGFRQLGWEINPRIAVLAFGLVHGFGLATKLQELDLNPNGLLVNLISFNAGVEIGQLIALSIILAAITLWRLTPSFGRFATAANALLFLAGVVLAGQQIAGYFIIGG